jgi:hypothetical protein
MEAIILSKEQFDQLIAKIDDINERLQNTNPKRTETYLNNKQFMEMLETFGIQMSFFMIIL